MGVGVAPDLRAELGAAMIVELKGAQLVVHERHTAILADVPQECTECHRMTHFFENRQGRTSCTACVVEKGYAK